MNVVYHYTSFDCFRSMLKECKNTSTNKSVTFWASSAYDMDDQTEMNFGYPVIKHTLEEYERDYKFQIRQRLIDICTAEPKLITKPDENFFLTEQRTPFVISFSHVHNDEKLWEEYGDHKRGICLLFDADGLAELAHNRTNNFFTDIAYLTHRARDKETMLTLVKIIEEEAKRAQQLIPRFKNEEDITFYKKYILESICPVISAAIKEETFSWENEVRWISLYDNNYANKREVDDERKVDYIEIKIPFKYFISFQCGSKFNRNDELITLCKECNIDMKPVNIKWI